MNTTHTSALQLTSFTIVSRPFTETQNLTQSEQQWQEKTPFHQEEISTRVKGDIVELRFVIKDVGYMV